MKKLFALLAVIAIVSVSISAQNKQSGKTDKYNEISLVDSIAKNTEEIKILANTSGYAGYNLRMSGYFQTGAYASAVAGTALACFSTTSKKTSERDALLVSGAALGAVGLVLQYFAIDYKIKAGRHLQFAGDKIIFRF